jgi:hypothetical protein
MAIAVHVCFVPKIQTKVKVIEDPAVPKTYASQFQKCNLISHNGFRKNRHVGLGIAE